MSLFLRALACLLLLLPLAHVRGAVPRDFAVDLAVTTGNAAPYLTLSWTQRLQSNITAQNIHRRVKGQSAWVLQQALSTTDTNYADMTAAPNIEYEYWLERRFTGVSPSTAMGYISAGVAVPAVEDRGTILLVIDDTMVTPLGPEIAQLRADLVADGWTVQSITAPRTGTAISTKALIKAAYDAAPTQVKMVYLLGQVPVPYSGQIAPDAHGDHVGAWPADGYYGDMNGTWTDTTVNNTSAGRTQNQNIPGDGKFDQSTLPSGLELAVGRVHMRGMLRAPSANLSETALLRRYLRKAHDYRYRLGAYANVPRRSLIRDGFGHAFTTEPFAMSGWGWAFSSVGTPPFAPVVDEAPSGQWFTFAGANTYLVGHGDGGGSYESASSVGTSLEFGRKASRVVFTQLFGSYHGDWDSDNNFMRAALAGNATGDSLGLTCVWAGRPSYFMHHTGLGETVGYSVRASMNGVASLAGASGAYTPGGGSFGGVHMGLMGDPALRLQMVLPPRGFTLTSANGAVNLAWTASTETALQGYHVYRADNAAGPFTRLTTTPISTTYSDSTVTAGQTYTYMVRTLKLETVPGGSYFNLSQGSLGTITASAAATPAPANPASLSVTQSSGANAVLAWSHPAADEAGFRIERKTNATGAFAAIGTAGANAIGFTDGGPFTASNVYYYRVVATGNGGDSLASNEVSFDAVGGYFDFNTTRMRVNKATGVATIPVNRFGGATGAVSVSYATANSSAVAGIHYGATSGSLTWADGDSAPKNISVPLLNSGSPHLPRQFTVSLNSPSAGTSLAQFTSMAVLIEDSSATLPAAWTSTMLGSVTDAAPAVEAEGALGGAQIGGSGIGAGDQSDAGRYVYQQRAGDTRMVVHVPTPTPAQSAARFAIMVRASAAANAQIVAAVTSGDATGYGAKLAYRTTAGGNLTETPATSNGAATPRWLRMTRFGDAFTAEFSTDGTTWSALATVTVALPATALWGVYHSAADVNTTTQTGEYQLGAFTNVSLGPLPAPAAPGAFGATYAAATVPYVNLTWSSVPFVTGYVIERRTEGETSWTQIASPASGTTSYADNTIAADTAYEYRITAQNSGGNSPTSPTARAATPPADAVITIPAAADATVRASSPGSAFGGQTSISVCGSDVSTASTSTIAKTWLRFDLNGVPTVKTAKLKLGVISTSLAGTFSAGKTFASSCRLLPDASDTWDEATVTWNTAPQNDTAGLTITGTGNNLGTYNLGNAAAVPANNTVVSVALSGSLLYNNRGANGIATIAFVPGGQSGAIDFASREQGTLPAPALELTYTASLPRPSFLSAVPGAVMGIALSWTDNATSETGYRLERRRGIGAFELVQNLAASATSFTDSAATPGETYEYRVRAAGSPGDSTWSVSAIATAAPYTYQYWLQANGLPPDGSGEGAPGACPKADGFPNLLKAALGLPPAAIGSAGRLTYGTVNVLGDEYLSVTYTRPEPAPSGMSYVVQTSSDVTGWSSAESVEVSSAVDGPLRTITVRDATPIPASGKRFLRLRVLLP